LQRPAKMELNGSGFQLIHIFYLMILIIAYFKR